MLCALGLFIMVFGLHLAMCLFVLLYFGCGFLWVYEVIILYHLSFSQRLAESFPMLNYFRLDYTRSPTRWTFFSTGLSFTCPTHCSCAIFLVVVFTSQRLVINLLRLYAFYPD